jgi:putative holliday junction resolvase
MTALPPRGRLAGIDFGDVRVGIAITDPDRLLASPLETYMRRALPEDARYFRELVENEGITGFVIGLPVYPSGQESQKSLEVRRFGAWLEKVTGRPIAYVDERYTTRQAETLLSTARLTRGKRKSRRDMLAAQIILTSYLESPHLAESPPESLG